MPLPVLPCPTLYLKIRTVRSIVSLNLPANIWASWCAPCVAEVPHLQKLEKDLNRRDIVFVSISLDTKRENWEKQMEQLHMHGNQWLVRDEAFADMMNVKGIPHFLLYGKDGTLLDYKTARPSSGDLLKSRLEHLP